MEIVEAPKSIVVGGRIRCLVPGCGRTFKVERDIAFTICGKHWRLAPKAWRLRFTKFDRRWKKTRDERIGWLANYIWHRCARRAVDVALGIGT